MRKKLCQKWFAVLLGIVLLFQQSVVYATATETESPDSLTYSVIWEQMEHFHYVYWLSPYDDITWWCNFH